MNRIKMFFRKNSLRSGWGVHKKMTINCSDTRGYGNFEDFIREYNKRTWERDKRHIESHFGVGDCHNENKIHARIIKFNGVGMVLDLESFVLFIEWEASHTLTKDQTIEPSFNNINQIGDC